MSDALAPTLPELQSWMRWLITEPQGVQRALENPVHEPILRCLPAIDRSGSIDVHDRLRVYSNAYFLRLLEVLREEYPAIQKVIGVESFGVLVCDYLKAYPSSSPNIADLGKDLPEFLKTHSISQSFPYLSDLASFERLFLMTVFADRAPDFDSTQLQSLSESEWSEIRFVLDSSVHFFHSTWPVDLVWDVRDIQEQPVPQINFSDRNLLLFRDPQWVRVRVLSMEERVLLGHLSEGMPLGQACDQTQSAFPDSISAERIQTWFATWIQLGIIKGVLLP